MLQQLTLYWNLCVFQTSPSQLVANRTVLLALFGVNMVLAAAAALMATATLNPVYLGAALTTVVLMLAGIYGILYVRNHRNRFVQTACAYIGTGIIQDIVFICLISLQMQEIKAIGVMAVGIWRIGVVGYILHKALEFSLLQGILLSFGLTMLISLLVYTTIGLPDPLVVAPPVTTES